MKYNLTNKQKAFLYLIKRCGIYTVWVSYRKKYFYYTKIFYGCKDNTFLDFINRKDTIGSVILSSFSWGETTFPVRFWRELSVQTNKFLLEDLLDDKETFDEVIDIIKNLIKELNNGKF